MHLKSPCHDASFSPVTRCGRSQVCCRQKALVKGLSGFLVRCSPNHGRMVKSHCRVPLVSAHAVLGHGHVGPLQLLNPSSIWTGNSPMAKPVPAEAASEVPREGRRPRRTSNGGGLAAWEGHAGGGTEGKEADGQRHRATQSITVTILPPPSPTHQGSMNMTVRRPQLLVFLINP